MRASRLVLLALVLFGAVALIPDISPVSLTPVAHAADEHDGGHGDEIGGPNATLWKTANFILLIGIAYYLLRGKVAPFFEERNRAIAREMNAAAEREAEAQARLKAVEEKISGLETEIAQLREHSREEMERDRERVEAETAQAIARIQENSAREIESAGIIARAQLSKHAAALAMEVAEQQVRARVAQPGMQDRLLAQALERAAEASRN